MTLIFGDPHWREASLLWDSWLSEGVELVAPPLFRAEVTSVIRERSFRGDLTVPEAQDMLSMSLGLPVRSTGDLDDLQRRALDLSIQFGRPKAYDAQYLAVADLLGCELWTADRRLVNVVSRDLPWVHHVEEAA